MQRQKYNIHHALINKSVIKYKLCKPSYIYTCNKPQLSVEL